MADQRQLGEYMVAMRMEDPKRKTQVWIIYAKRNMAVLGQVSWKGSWRQYAFRPSDGSVFNPGCMDDLSAFCRELTAAHRKKR